MKLSKKHVLLIVENNSAPNDIRVWREASALKNIGKNISIISPKTKVLNKSFEIVNGIHIYRYANTSDNNSIKGMIIEYLNAFLKISYLSLKIFFKNRYYVMHAANPPDYIFLIAIVYRCVGVKYIFDHHDLSPELYLAKYKKEKNSIYYILLALEKFSCKFANIVISTNNSYKDIVRKRHNIDESKIFVVRNDPNIREINIDKIECKTPNNVNLLYLGTINEQDGVELLIEALKHIVHDDNIKEFKCKIVGDGSNLGKIIELVKRYRLYNYIEFKGFISDRNLIRDIIKESDICLEPAPYNYVNNHSTFIKIMEYMSFGKAVVAFDLVETRYSVGDSAILVDANSTYSFAHGIKLLMNNKALRDKLGRSARNRIIKKLNWKKSEQELIKVYSFL